MRSRDRIEFFEREAFLDFFLVLFGMDDMAFADAVFAAFGNEFDEVVLRHSGEIKSRMEKRVNVSGVELF